MGLEGFSDEDFKEIGRLFAREEGSIMFLLYLGDTGSISKDELIKTIEIDDSRYDFLISTYKNLGLVEGNGTINLTEKGRILYNGLEDNLKKPRGNIVRK